MSTRADGEPGTPCVGAVLAGGRSARLGRPKASVDLAGRPLISYPLAAAKAAGLETIVIAKPDSELPRLACPIVRTEPTERHPAAGIAEALAWAGGRPAVVIACDMPFVPAGLLSWLARLGEPIAAPMVGGRLHPLLARYEPSTRERLRSCSARKLSLRACLRGPGVRELSERDLRRFGDPERILFNVNTPADLEAARRTAVSAGDGAIDQSPAGAPTR
jgi:molybdopterin-guanine dinucleotide biosynthesis protein A